jgi:hypothetical protein
MVKYNYRIILLHFVAGLFSSEITLNFAALLCVCVLTWDFSLPLNKNILCPVTTFDPKVLCFARCNSL